MAYTNELSYLLEDDDKSIELHILYPQLMHFKYFVLYYYLFIDYFRCRPRIACMYNNSDVCYIYGITLIMKYSIENCIRISVGIRQEFGKTYSENLFCHVDENIDHVTIHQNEIHTLVYTFTDTKCMIETYILRL